MIDNPPYISLVVTGRNDGYGGDFIGRFLTTLRFNLRELAARQIAHEVVLVEWAPLLDRRPLADIIDEDLSHEAAAHVRTILVDPAYHDALSLNPRLQYQEFIAKNVGARRARGEFVLTTNCDVLLGRHVLDTLQRRSLDRGVVYRAARYDLRAGAEEDAIDWTYLEDPRMVIGPMKRLRPPHFGGGTGDFIALDRSDFERIGGFNEVFRAARIGIDRNFLIQARSRGLRIVDIGGPVYHVNHDGSFRLVRQRYLGREAEAPYGDARWHSNHVVYCNPPTWGLAEAPARELTARRTWLEFSQDAVPPLVALHRIVVPVARSATAERAAPRSHV